MLSTVSLKHFDKLSTFRKVWGINFKKALKNPFEDQKHYKYINTLYMHNFYNSKTNI